MGQEGEHQEEGAGAAGEGWSQWGDEIGTGNLQVGTRLALGLLGRNMPETGTLVGMVEERAELEVISATGVDHTVSWAYCDKGPYTTSRGQKSL